MPKHSGDETIVRRTFIFELSRDTLLPSAEPERFRKAWTGLFIWVRREVPIQGSRRGTLIRTCGGRKRRPCHIQNAGVRYPRVDKAKVLPSSVIQVALPVVAGFAKRPYDEGVTERRRQYGFTFDLTFS
jgi:hypothetical protein